MTTDPVTATDEEANVSSAEEPSVRGTVLPMVRGLAWDIGLPVAAYYALHLLGATDWVALLAATGVAAVRIVWGAARHRTFNQFATVMLLVYGIGLLLAVTTGDPRALLLKSSLVTAAVGAVFLVTGVRGTRPLTLAAMESFVPTKAARFAEWYRTNPQVHRAFRLTSVVWGIGLLAESIIRIPLVYLLPVDIGYGASEALFVAAFAGLMAWNGWYMHRLQARRRSA